MDWVTIKAASGGLAEILATLNQDSQPLVANLISPVLNTTRGRQEHADLVSECPMMPIHYICSLTLNLNACCITVEGYTSSIYVPSLGMIRFEL